MRIKLLVAVISVALVGSAAAADLPRSAPVYKAPPIVPSFSWTGAYLGANLGYALENTQTDYSYSSIPAPAPPGFNDIFGPGGPLNVGGSSAVNSAIALGFIPTHLGDKSKGVFTVGGQVGYNYQVNQFVGGIEADFNWFASGVKTTSFNSFLTVPGAGFLTNAATAKSGIDWLGTLRARAGYAFGTTMLFVTGGLAYGHVISTSSAVGFDGANADPFYGSGSGTRTGYAVGGGVEHSFAPHLSAKLEYLYYDLGTVTYPVAAANIIAAGEGLFVNASQKFDGHIIRVGANYHF